MDFARTELLNILFILPFLIVLFCVYFLWQKNIVTTKFNQTTFQKINPNYSNSIKIIHFFLRFCAIILFIVVIAGPRIGTKLKTLNREGIDVVFAIDVSKSMLVTDIAPNRLAKSIQIVSKSIDKLISDRVGIIIYAGEALPLMPLSFDYSMAKLLIKTIDTDLVNVQGTDLSSAISLSNSFFDNEERNKIIFLLSDGEDHEGNYQKEIDNLFSKNTVISSINIGTESGGPIPFKLRGEINYKKDKNDNVVISKSNSEVLRAISSSCNGSFIKTQNTQDAVGFIFNNMDQLDRSFQEEELFSDYEDQYQWFLAFALLFILIDLILTQKKINFIRQIIKYD